MSELGGTLGIALLGALATALYGGMLDRDSLPPALEMTSAIGVVSVVAMAATLIAVLRPALLPSALSAPELSRE